VFQDLYVVAGLGQGVVGAGVEAGEPSAQLDQAGPALPQVILVEVGVLQLAPGRRSEGPRDVHDLFVLQVEPGVRPVGPGVLGLLLDGDQPPVPVRLAHAVALWIAHLVAEEHATVRAALDPGDPALEQAGEARTVEDVVAEDESSRLLADVVGANQERLRQPVRGGGCSA
jgi:hypothetical protein